MSVSVTEAKIQFSKFLNRVAYGGERIIITSHGKPKAALVSMDDLERLGELEEIVAIIEAGEEYEAGDTLDWEEVKRDAS